jgi:hypothetical protein
MQTEFVITGGDRTEPLHPLEEVLHPVTEAVSATVEWDASAPRGPWCYTCLSPSPCEMGTQLVAVVTLVRDHPLSGGRGDGFGDSEIRALPRIQPYLERTATAVYQRGELGVKSSLGTPNGLKKLASGGICSVLVQLDVRGIQVPELSFGARFQPAKYGVPKAEVIPATPSGVDSFPGAENLRQVSPRAAGASPEDHRLDHTPMTPRRTTTRRYRYRARMAFLNFFNRSQSESRRKKRCAEAMIVTAQSDTRSLSFVHFSGV